MEGPWLKWWTGIGVLVGALLLFGVIAHDPDGVFGERTAAWVEAVGVIVGVFTAALIPRVTQAEERSRRRREAILLADLLVQAMSAAATYEGEIQPWTSDEALDAAFRELDVSALTAAVERFPLDKLESVRATEAMIRLAGLGREADGELALMRDPVMPSTSIGFQRAAADLIRAVESSRLRLADLQAAVGSG